MPDRPAHTRGLKADRTARAMWGKDYDKIPKSVFATIAWHLANIASGEVDAHGAALSRFDEEWTILHDGGHVPQKPLRRAKWTEEA